MEKIKELQGDAVSPNGQLKVNDAHIAALQQKDQTLPGDITDSPDLKIKSIRISGEDEKEGKEDVNSYCLTDYPQLKLGEALLQ